MALDDIHVGLSLSICLDTWRKDVKPPDIVVAINEAAPGKIRVVSVAEVMLPSFPVGCCTSTLLKLYAKFISLTAASRFICDFPCFDTN